MHTYASALRLVGVTVPDHLVAEAEVPILTGPQAQGDLLVRPAAAPSSGRWRAVPTAGVQVLHGEATGNSHWLHPGFDSPGVAWLEAAGRDAPDDLIVGHLRVPAGQYALLIHTDEHGANGIGAGEYAVHRKRQARITFTPVPSRGGSTFVDD